MHIWDLYDSLSSGSKDVKNNSKQEIPIDSIIIKLIKNIQKSPINILT